MLTTEKIGEWLYALADIPQLDFIRIGTRTPVTFPDRISSDKRLLNTFREVCTRKQIYVVTHFNHPNEFTSRSIEAILDLQECGIIVKNQTVLLKGINDDPETLGKLLRMVTKNGIIQHYIFQCRPVTGVKNYFQVPIKKGCEIVRKANAMQNGLGKSAFYTMSHKTGKITILGEMDGKMLFQYRQAKNSADIGRIFSMDISDEATWLE